MSSWHTPPHYASWLNRIEAQFRALRYFTLAGTDHPDHATQARLIRRYIAWRNRNTDNPRLRALLNTANVARRPQRTPMSQVTFCVGAVISPCLCDVCLHRLDRQWAQRGHGTLVRFADDLLAMCHSRAEAEAAFELLRQILGELGLQLKDARRPASCWNAR